MNKSPKNEPSLEVLVARFAYASAAVLTLSDMLSTISAGLALRLVEETATTNTSVNGRANSNASRTSSNNSLSSVEVEQMQRQMDELISEMKRLKKMMF